MTDNIPENIQLLIEKFPIISSKEMTIVANYLILRNKNLDEILTILLGNTGIKTFSKKLSNETSNNIITKTLKTHPLSVPLILYKLEKVEKSQKLIENRLEKLESLLDHKMNDDQLQVKGNPSVIQPYKKDFPQDSFIRRSFSLQSDLFDRFSIFTKRSGIKQKEALSQAMYQYLQFYGSNN